MSAARKRNGPGGVHARLPWWACDQTGATSNLALLDHLEDDGSGLASFFLANEALRGGARLQGVCIDAEAADMRVGSYEADASELLALRDCDDGLCAIDRVRRAGQPRGVWGPAS